MTGSSTKLSWRRSFPAASPFFAGAMLALLFPGVSAIRACMSSAAPEAVVLASGDERFDTAVSQSLYPLPVPSWLVEVSNADEVAAVIQCANEEGVKVCARTGGHSFTGRGQCAGVMVDLVKMKSFSFDADNNEITVGGGNTLGEMFYKTDEASGGSRMIGIGLCPSVGVAGYVLGGGFNPYAGLNGLTCESAVSFDMVMADASKKTVTSASDSELFWASCGGGGGAFSILTSVTFRTTAAGVFNNNVYFRYRWPIANAGEALHEFVDYDNENGNVWIRLEISLSDDLVGYGACWESPSVADCESRLEKAAFFNVAGRETVVAEKASSVTEFQKFIGPAGNWAREIPTISDEAAFVGTNYDEAGLGLKRTYTSGYWRFGNNKPSAAVFQQVADILKSTDTGKVAFMLAQFNPWEGAHKANAENYAFPHRDMDAFTEFIGGKDDAEGAEIEASQAELKRVHEAILDTLGEWKAGVYVNYPELGLADDEYSYLYWGSSLQRLATLRGQLDPQEIFDGKQPMNSGSVGCPGTLSITGTGISRDILIEGYPFGQLSGMRTKVQASQGCSLDDAEGATLNDEGDGTYEAIVDGGSPFNVTMSAAACSVSVVTINGITCSTDTAVATT